MTSKIIELRQADADVVNTNGDYSVNLKYTNDLIVEEGDQIILKNIFVDTLAQSDQKINLPLDTTLDLKFSYYYVYSRQDGFVEPVAGSGVPAIDGENWVWCYDVNKGQGTQTGNTRTMTTLILRGTYTDPVDAGTATVTYIDIDDNQQQKKVPYPQSASRQDPSVDVPVSIVYKEGTTPSIDPGGGADSASFVSVDNDENILLSPIIGQLQITLEQGSYTPEQLVAEFNRLVQSAVKGNIANNVYTNEFFQDTTNFVDEYQAGNVYIANTSTGAVAKFDDQGQTILVAGASFVELAFIEAQNQFAFNYIHTPYYQDAVVANNQVVTPALVSVGYLPTGGNNYISINKNCGVVFESMTSTYADGTDAKFFDNILGFNTSGDAESIVTTYTKFDFNAPNVADIIHSLKSVNPLEDGINTTGGYMALTAEMNLVAQDNKKWWQSVRDVVDTGSGFFSTSDDTYDILAGQKNTSQNQFRFGYYLVSVEADFRSQFFGKNIKQNVMAILSRYYESNSFTSGTDADSITYTHMGSPLNLQKFHVKILKPDKTIADNLGNESAIYLELIKAQKQ